MLGDGDNGRVSTASAPSRPIRYPVVLIADALVLLVFAAVGRREHDSGNPVLGVFDTAWPFLAGALAGHLIALALRRPPGALGSGVVVWVTAVAGGMLLRQATGDGTAFSFIVVATCFTGFFLLGWRLVAALVARRRG